MNKKKTNNKKMSKLIVILSVLVLCTISTFGATFKDVPATHWAYVSIIDMQKRGAMLPNSSGQFFPNKTMSYFEMADTLAKATGYVDVEINKNIDATFKKQIINNYEAQKPTLTTYQTKYKAWDKLYNQQIAYLLGRGYLKKEELDKFIIKAADNKETKNIVTKQQLAVFLVRILGKEETAKTTYIVSGFSDDNIIAAANKPYAGYLKAIGLVNADAKGMLGANTKVTRALCAKMLGGTLAYKEKKTGTTTPVPANPQTNPPTSSDAQTIVTVKRIVPKSSDEYYIQLEKGSNISFYSIKNTTKVTDATGSAVTISAIPIESKATVVITKQNNTDYITSMKLQGTASTGSVDANTITINGAIARIGTNGALSILLSDDSTTTYLMGTNCVVIIDGRNDLIENVKTDDSVKATIQSNLIIKLEIQTSSASGNNTSSQAEGEVTAKAIKTKGYTLTIKKGTKTSKLDIDEDVSIKRNNKKSEWEDIKIGDKVKIVQDRNEITELIVTGTRSNIEGKVKSISIAQTSEVTIITDDDEETFIINDNTEIYDDNEKENISLRELRIGQEVEILIESKEVISLVVQRNNSKVKYNGTIESIGNRTEYIDVLVDYDPLTDASRVIKRIKTPLEVEIVLNGKQEHRSIFEVGMDVLITYQYLDDAIPEKILILE